MDTGEEVNMPVNTMGLRDEAPCHQQQTFKTYEPNDPHELMFANQACRHKAVTV